VTGASGQVGRAVRAAAPNDADVLAVTHSELDISDAAAVKALVASFAPAFIINAAAYTAVDAAESDPDTATSVNVIGPRNLAQAAAADPDCRMAHISTDYVFDGTRGTAYQPDDTPNPLGVYGRTKLEGERAVTEVLPTRSVIVRTSWVYAPAGRNFVFTMLRLMRERGSVRVVADQRGSPTAAASIARALWRLAKLPRVAGILHWTDAGVISWYEFACAIAEDALAGGLLARNAGVAPIGTADYPTAARRPANSALDTHSSARVLGIDPEPWRERLRTTLGAIRSGSSP